MAFAAAVACIVLAAWLIFDLCSLLPDGNAGENQKDSSSPKCRPSGAGGLFYSVPQA